MPPPPGLQQQKKPGYNRVKANSYNPITKSISQKTMHLQRQTQITK